MRLPTLTAEQAGNEDARAFHEALWGSYQTGIPFILPLGEKTASIVVKRTADCFSAFWRRRGYRLRQAKTIGGVRVWLEALEQKAIA